MDNSGKITTNAATKSNPKRRLHEDSKPKAKRRRSDSADWYDQIADTYFPILNLPVDILIEIIRRLPMAQWPSLEQVCSRFRLALIGNDEVGIHGAWRSVRKIDLEEDLILHRISFRKFPVTTWQSLFEKLLLRSPNLAEIVGFRFITEFGITAGFGNPPPSNEELTKFFGILGQFKSLKRISFVDCGFYMEDILGFIRTSASRGCFREVDISYNQYRDLGLKTVDFGDDPALKLEKLSCHNVEYAKSLIIIDVSHLTVLDLEDTWLDCDRLIPIIKGADRLERLDFAGPLTLDEKSMAACKDLFGIVATLASKNLVALGISNIVLYHQDRIYTVQLIAAFEQLFEACGRHGHLKELSLLGLQACNAPMVDSIAKNLTGLESLRMDVIGDSINTPLIQLIGRLTKLKQLVINYDAYSNVGFYHPGIYAEVICGIARNLTELESLTLIGNSCSALDKWAHLGLLENLKELRLNISRIDNGSLIAWGNTFGPKLESLELTLKLRDELGNVERECQRNGYVQGLISLLKKAISLRRSQLNGPNISNRHLEIIAASCRRLRELYVSYFPNPYKPSVVKIDLSSGAQAVVNKCAQLRRFRIDVGGYRQLDYSRLKVDKYRKICYGLPKYDKLSFE